MDLRSARHICFGGIFFSSFLPCPDCGKSKRGRGRGKKGEGGRTRWGRRRKKGEEEGEDQVGEEVQEGAVAQGNSQHSPRVPETLLESQRVEG